MTLAKLPDNPWDVSPSTVDGKEMPTPPVSVAGGNASLFRSSIISRDEISDCHCGRTVLWPGTTYMIAEKASGLLVTCDGDGQVLLHDPDAAASSTTDNSNTTTMNFRWLCVESNNHFAFQNPQTGLYLGHDGQDRMQARIGKVNDWEHIIARPHPDGGYQLLSKYWWHTLKIIVVGEDGKSLVRRMHGTTRFEFQKLC
ncbi:hypothetical protein PG985_009966 [Apiospora marii]|uniref:Fascin domain-containing protein n=1 Tax=Apiospora marii TaxID=335849 RepID=A0ABR1RKK9_9PEZI